MAALQRECVNARTGTHRLPAVGGRGCYRGATRQAYSSSVPQEARLAVRCGTCRKLEEGAFRGRETPHCRGFATDRFLALLGPFAMSAFRPLVRPKRTSVSGG